MRILAVSDQPAGALYDYYRPGCLDEYDLILSCGDLDARYLEFLVTMARCPLVYVLGNHDEALWREPPEGCDSAEDKIVVVGGVRVLGLGGSIRYKDYYHTMHTEKEMRRRIRRLRRRLRKAGGFDILLAHSPARGLNDLDTPTHQGFECFRELLEEYRPRYFVHGHVHQSYDHQVPRRSQLGPTTVINAYDHYAFDY